MFGSVYDNFHWREVAGDTVGADSLDSGDEKAFAASQAPEGLLLPFREPVAGADFGDGVAHGVKDDGLEADHAERRVEQTVIDGCTESLCLQEQSLGERSATFIVVDVSFCIGEGDVGGRIRELAHTEFCVCHRSWPAVD